MWLPLVGGPVYAVRLDYPLGHASMHLALGCVELFATALLHPNDFPDVDQVILHLNQSVQHVGKN